MLKAVTRRCSVKKMFLKILRNSQENTSLTQVFSFEFCEFSENTYFNRTPEMCQRRGSVFKLIYQLTGRYFQTFFRPFCEEVVKQNFLKKIKVNKVVLFVDRFEKFPKNISRNICK